MRSEKVFLFSYFLFLILVGTALLNLPFSWQNPTPLRLIDSFFTATSAVCVTGLITVNTADYSFWGQIIILILIQGGGLGIISFTTVYIILPRRRISLKNIEIIKSYTLDSVENQPKNIIRQIILLTLSIETIGTIALYLNFRPLFDDGAVFASVFHAISAFCNAGFSIFPNSLENYSGHWGINLSIAVLVILGGLGFIVFQDIGKKIARTKRTISFHSKIVLVLTGVFVVTAVIVYFLLEREGAFRHLSPAQKWLAAFFQAITPRTAGFNTIAQNELSVPSQVFTLPLMFIGGSSGSIAGGIKITTIFLVFMLILRERDARDEINLFNRKIPSGILSNAAVFVVRALLILFTSIFLLTMTEHIGGASQDKSLMALVFESFSAFGTVGLTLGITPSLTSAGKIIIILTMFAGRVGLISIAMGGTDKISALHIDYPKGEVMIG